MRNSTLPIKPRILLLFTLLCAVVASLQTVRAATITVINTNDSSSGSLRQALADANDGDTIDFSVTGTITLTTGQLVAGKSVTISGPGANQLTVQRSTDVGTPDFRIFYISSGKTATISGLTITNGHPSGSFPDDSGGGIYNDHAILTVGDCTLTGNSATWGGGIYNAGFSSGSATLTVSNSTVTGNSADGDNFSGGGGIYNDGENNGSATVAISNSTLSSNSAPCGGSIYNDGAFAGNAASTVNNSTLSGNSAANGGVIYNKAAVGPPSNPGSATVTISNSTLSNNSATSSGGGIYNFAGDISNATLTISNSTLSGNSAANGGGIYNDASAGAAVGAGDAMLAISNSTLSSNSATSSGGGIYNVAEPGRPRVTITNSTLSGNSAASFGGGIYNDGSLDNRAAVTIGDTILNAGASGANIYNQVSQDGNLGTVISLGHNLSSDDASAFLNASGDQNGTDPLLGPLQNNGGSTFTHMLLAGSPAIDAGAPPLDYDQRGPSYPRVVNGRIDIGAFEVQSAPIPTPTPTAIPKHTPPPHPTPRGR